MSAGRELQPRRLEGKIRVCGDAAASLGRGRLSGERVMGKLGQQTLFGNRFIFGRELVRGN